MKHINTLIIGAGITGISTAYHLQRSGYDDYLIVDSRPKGLCITKPYKGFLFDIAGHVIHYRTTYYKEFVESIMGTNLLKQRRKAYFVFQHHLLPYPFQAYFYMIPNHKVVNECIRGLEGISKFGTKQKPENFKEWLITNFGTGIANHFLIPYNQKVWRFPLEKISLDWVEKYVPKININEILRVAKGISNYAIKEYGYNPIFFYPKYGGIQAVIDAMINKMGNQFNSCFKKSNVSKISIAKKIAILNNGTKIKWNNLVSTIPLPELVKLIVDAPSIISSYARMLKHTSLLSINLGIRGEIKTDAHWIYFPEQNVPFHRVVIQSNLSPYVSPDLSYSLIIERSFRAKKVVSMENIIDQVITNLLKNGFIKNRSDILTTKVNLLRYAYPIYDIEHYEKKSLVVAFLKYYSVHSIGRFGSWEYFSMEDCFLQGKNTAESIAKGNEEQQYL